MACSSCRGLQNGGGLCHRGGQKAHRLWPFCGLLHLLQGQKALGHGFTAAFGAEIVAYYAVITGENTESLPPPATCANLLIVNHLEPLLCAKNARGAIENKGLSRRLGDLSAGSEENALWRTTQAGTDANSRLPTDNTEGSTEGTEGTEGRQTDRDRDTESAESTQRAHRGATERQWQSDMKTETSAENL